ncbi:MAG TPA: SMI1/KNR4 family protein [Cyanophyceae cyanobacterium]
MDELWSALEEWLGQHLPEVLADFNPGCLSEEFTDLEHCLDCRLPEDVKAFYRRHDGQKGQTTGLFCGLPFLSTLDLYDQWSGWRDLALEDEEIITEIESESYPDRAIKPVYINLKWIPLAHDGSGNHLGVDLDPDTAGVVGQVINFGADETRKFVLADSLTDFMAWMLAQYQAGNYQSSERSLALQEPQNTHFLDIVPILFGRP